MEDSTLKDQLKNDGLADKIVTYFGYFEEYSLKTVAQKCAKLVISEHFKDICYENFELPSLEEMKELVMEELYAHFDEKVTPLIEQTYPNLSDEAFDEKLDMLEKLYAREHEEQLASTANAALKELRVRVKALRKELRLVKKKYTI